MGVTYPPFQFVLWGSPRVKLLVPSSDFTLKEKMMRRQLRRQKWRTQMGHCIATTYQGLTPQNKNIFRILDRLAFDGGSRVMFLIRTNQLWPPGIPEWPILIHFKISIYADFTCLRGTYVNPWSWGKFPPYGTPCAWPQFPQPTSPHAWGVERPDRKAPQNNIKRKSHLFHI